MFSLCPSLISRKQSISHSSRFQKHSSITFCCCPMLKWHILCSLEEIACYLDSGFRARVEKDVCWNWLLRTLEKASLEKLMNRGQPDLNTEFADFILEFFLETSLSHWRNINYSGRKRNLLTRLRKFVTNIPRKENARPQSQFPPSCVCEWFIYSQDRSAHFATRKYVDRSWEYINRSQTHECGNCDWGRVIPRKGIHKWDFHGSVKTRKTLGKVSDTHTWYSFSPCHRSLGRLLIP